MAAGHMAAGHMAMGGQMAMGGPAAPPPAPGGPSLIGRQRPMKRKMARLQMGSDPSSRALVA